MTTLYPPGFNRQFCRPPHNCGKTIGHPARLHQGLCRSIHIFLLVLTGLTGIAQASTTHQVEQLLAAAEAPFGVVFEIVEGDDNALQWAIPAVNHYVKQLRDRFPDIALAVVTHGSEQFALTRDQQNPQALLHQQVQSLVANDVPLHVCGTHASWRDKQAEDFPDYVDVAPAGPTEIRNYQSMGFALIRVQR